jgi:hypothetical protein
MRLAFSTLVLLLSLLLEACSPRFLPGESNPTLPPPSVTSTSLPTYTPLTLVDLQNAEYTLTDMVNGNPLTIRLSSGIFQRGNDSTQPDFMQVRMGDAVAFGDLNGDGIPDAVITLAVNFGGTGVFVFLVAVLNENGLPRHVASHFVDDRPIIKQLIIDQQTIHVDTIVHGPDDPGCCPAEPISLDLRLTSGVLTLIGVTSQTPEGQERRILIESPVEGARVHGILSISGRVSIAPFENTLRYRLTTDQGTTLRNGSITINATRPGAPASFTFTLDLGGLPPGSFYLELADISPVDGRIQALTTVHLSLE